MLQVRPKLTPPQVVPQPATSQRASRAGPPASATRRPQCTHMTMNRLYGEHTCQMCGKVPNIGWVYACKQDELLGCRHTLTDSENLPVVADSGDYFEAQAKVAESLGTSTSVIKQMRDGEYSFDQMETLLQQRRHVIDVIKRAESGPSVQSTPPSPQGSASKSHLPSENAITSVGVTAAPTVQQVGVSSLPMTPAGTPANTPAESASNTPTKKIKTVKKSTCNFQVCHACRPFLRDRLPMSFEPVLNNEMPAVTEDEIAKLPFLDPGVTRNLGLRQGLQDLSAIQTEGCPNIAMHQADGYGEETSTDWTPTTTSDSQGESDSLEDAEDPFPCPGAGICPLFSPIQGCAYDNGFDDGQRATNHGFIPDQDVESYNRLRHIRGSITSTPGGTSSTGSSISLPDPETAPLTPATPSDTSFGPALMGSFGKSGKAPTVCGVMREDRKSTYGFSRVHGVSGKDSNSSLGSEVEVDGGVALTEEAVGTGLPDIFTTE